MVSEQIKEYVSKKVEEYKEVIPENKLRELQSAITSLEIDIPLRKSTGFSSWLRRST